VGQGPDGRPAKDAPAKENDHAMDALRYATLAIDRKVPPVEPPAVREARERREADEAEQAWRSVDNPAWWEGGGQW
jgi:hypothetical protein